METIEVGKARLDPRERPCWWVIHGDFRYRAQSRAEALEIAASLRLESLGRAEVTVHEPR